MPREPRHEPEASTRRLRIDPQLNAAGWRVVPFDPSAAPDAYKQHAIREYPTANGPADYALCVDGQITGVIEAKRIAVGPQEVLTQAERYAKGLRGGTGFDFRGYGVPFLYSTNGENVWFHDVRQALNLSRKIAGFHTPAALREMLGRDPGRAAEWLATHPNDHPVLRPYQVEANAAIEAAIADRRRLMLVAMATGTGKTFTLVNQIYRLLASGVARRVLFLVDRRALAAQAVRAFASFEPQPNRKFDRLYEVYSQRFQRDDLEEAGERFDPKVLPASYLKTPRPQHTFVYVCTIQRMAVNLFGRGAVWAREGDEIDEDADKLSIPHHAFDVIVADECHRGYTTAEESLWRNTLDHFDAIKIGLTATPAAHTKAYFQDVVYRYEYARAVREGFLVDYDVVAVRSEVRMNGLFLEEGEQVLLVDPESGSEVLDRLEDERRFPSEDVERAVTSPDSNRRILEEVKRHADDHEERYGRFPKTLVFAAHDLPHTSHADQLVRLAREVFGRGDAFVRKITGRADRPLQLIREFRNRPEPGIVVSVDLMSTGIDIPDLECIVFLRPVKSRILFEQMLGRGTRKGVNAPDKSHFTVFDCFDGSLLAYFRQATGLTAEPPDKPSRTIKEVIDAIWDNRDRTYNVRCLVKRLRRIDKEMSGEGRELFQAHGIPEGDLGRWAGRLPVLLEQDFAGTMRLLRDEEFQALLVGYPRASRPYVVATENEDAVSARWVIRDALGRQYKPEDYLAAFARFVQDNPAHIEAIRILLNRPRNWSTRALTELRDKLKAAPELFTEERLRQAHQVHYHKALVDIISMVKHAAREQEPLLTAAERVERAFRKFTARRKFTEEQERWLLRIREHLVANLSIAPDDFDTIPVLERSGGWTRADSAFEGRLSKLIQALNEAIAA